MKTRFIILLALCMSMTSCAQGYLGFFNLVRVEGIDAPVFETDCTTRLQGNAFLAQLYVGYATDSLSPIGVPVPFLTGTAAGYVMGSEVGFLEWEGLSWVYAQIRAWESAAGSTYEQAVASGGKYGGSNLVRVFPSVPPSGPTALDGLQSFCLVPEPGAWSLALLGAAGVAVALRPGMRRQLPRRIRAFLKPLGGSGLSAGPREATDGRVSSHSRSAGRVVLNAPFLRVETARPTD